jgi:riboflavin kinase/FMN adenylyltransferase
MNTFDGLEEFSPSDRGIVLAIGNFDGVHRGHRRIIAVACGQARALGVPGVVMTFEPHPLVVVAPGRAPARLTTLAEKLALLQATDVDAVIVMRSEPALLNRSPEEFLTLLAERCRPRAIVAGATFNFGRGRQGSAETVRDCSGRFGYTAHVVDLVCAELPGGPVVSSSAIRQSLAQGRLEDANAMLGRPYRIVGTVGRGEGRGAPLGFPTANLEAVEHLLPHEAVYAAVAQLEHDEFHMAAANIGPQPTFGQSASRVEAHLLDFSGKLRGRRLGLHLMVKLRGQSRFADAGELAAQLHRDVDRTRSYVSALKQIQAGTYQAL